MHFNLPIVQSELLVRSTILVQISSLVQISNKVQISPKVQISAKVAKPPVRQKSLLWKLFGGFQYTIPSRHKWRLRFQEMSLIASKLLTLGPKQI